MKLYHVVFDLCDFETSHFVRADNSAQAIDFACQHEGAITEAAAGDSENVYVAEIPTHGKLIGYFTPEYRRYLVEVGDFGDSDLSITAM